jgi:hypothetical protein
VYRSDRVVVNTFSLYEKHRGMRISESARGRKLRSKKEELRRTREVRVRIFLKDEVKIKKFERKSELKIKN